MKKILATILLTLTFSLGLGTSVGASPHHHYTLPPSYKAVYCYPTGSYWVAQLSNPNNTAYYAANNAYYVSHYGATTEYC